jgi:tellurite resistance protein
MAKDAKTDKKGGAAKLSVHEALIYTMVITSAVDRQINDAELRRIGDIATSLPVFAKFDPNRLVSVAGACSSLVNSGKSFQEVLKLIAAALPKKLHETAYALAVEVAAADLDAPDEEVRFLELLSEALNVDKLAAAAIERSARVRYRLA